MTTVAVSCNWIFAMALATPIPESHLSCFTTCSALLPRAPSLIDTFEAASLMPNYWPKTKWHWAEARLQPAPQAHAVPTSVRKCPLTSGVQSHYLTAHEHWTQDRGLRHFRP